MLLMHLIDLTQNETATNHMYNKPLFNTKPKIKILIKTKKKDK